jgi:hypothetical protein
MTCPDSAAIRWFGAPKTTYLALCAFQKAEIGRLLQREHQG